MRCQNMSRRTLSLRTNSSPRHVPFSSVNCQSPAPLEGDVCYLVLRPLLDFSFCLFVWCSLHAVEMEKCSYNDKYYCFWHSGYKNRNMLLNVVQIVLEKNCVLFCFFVCLFVLLFYFVFEESTNLSDGPSPCWQSRKPVCQEFNDPDHVWKLVEDTFTFREREKQFDLFLFHHTSNMTTAFHSMFALVFEFFRKTFIERV